jgi:hypothetical protein
MLTDRVDFIHKLYNFLSLDNKNKRDYVIDNIDELFTISLNGEYAWGGNRSNNQLNCYYKNIPSNIKGDFDKYIDSKLAKYSILQRFKITTKKTFYICSYGGCGSKMLTRALSKYGNVEHVHARNPPLHLEYIGENSEGTAYCEWFNGIPVPGTEICNYYVIYLYRNPVKAILSRFWHPNHFINIQGEDVTINDVMDKMKDLYGIKQFYQNYTQRNLKRNYRILCVKYEDIFEKQGELSRYLGVGKLNLIKKETNRNEKETADSLNFIYKDLINEMSKHDSIFIN